MRAQMNEIHIWMNTLVVHSTISSENPKSDLDKSKQTINCVSLAVNVWVCARWEIMKSDNFSFDLPLSHLWGDISEQKKRQKWTKRGDQLCPLPTKHAIIWCVRFSSNASMCKQISVERVTVYLSSLKSHKSSQANKQQKKKTKINKAHLCFVCLCPSQSLLLLVHLFLRHPIRNEFSEIDVWTLDWLNRVWPM